jgi:hypothetical protein
VRSAKVTHRRCSRPLQRVITDFAADDPFAQARCKLQEHYGLKIVESTIQRIAFGHARAMFEAARAPQSFPETPGRHKYIVGQTDGGMIPIVETDAGQKDKRKGKKLVWNEAKISLAHAKGSKTPVYGGSRAAWKPLDGSYSNARFELDSARILTRMWSATSRPGS